MYRVIDLDKTPHIGRDVFILGLILYIVLGVLLITGSDGSKTLFQMTSRETAQRDFEEIFDTPFDKVTIEKYLNSKAGHSLRFRMLAKSSCPLQLKNKELYKVVGFDSPDATPNTRPEWFVEHHDPWIETCLVRKPGAIWVYLDKGGRTADVIALTWK